MKNPLIDILSFTYPEHRGKGDIVNVSLYGAAIWVMSSMLLRANPKYGKTFPFSLSHGDPLTNNYECADGEWCNISVYAYDKDAPLMYKLLGIEEDLTNCNGEKRVLRTRRSAS